MHDINFMFLNQIALIFIPQSDAAFIFHIGVYFPGFWVEQNHLIKLVRFQFVKLFIRCSVSGVVNGLYSVIKTLSVETLISGDLSCKSSNLFVRKIYHISIKMMNPQLKI